MKIHHLMFLSLLVALSGISHAQDKAPPTPAIAPAQSEIQKWIATTDAQWQATFKREVTDVREAELKKVMAQYKSSIDAAIAKASAAGDLDGAVVLRDEQERFFDTKAFPAQDLASEGASVKQFRAASRIALTKLEKDHAARVRALHAKYDQLLLQVQTQLTQRQRLDDALEVKAKRDEVAAAWLKEILAVPPSAVATNPSVTGNAGTAKEPRDGPPKLTAGGLDVLPSQAPGALRRDGFLISKKDVWIMSSKAFTPPVTITYVLKTDSQVRLRYAADEIIFNWELNHTELRIGGGPANFQHRKGEGTIPVNRLVTIRQVVLPDKMTISVDGKERGSWNADFSGVNQQIGVQSSHGSTVWVKQVLVNQDR